VKEAWVRRCDRSGVWYSWWRQSLPPSRSRVWGEWECGSHSLNHGVEGGCCDSGGVNEGPTCCTRKPHWGTVKKACNVDQYEALPMDESRRTTRRAAP
jgi:hypothetical protein